MSIGLNPSPGTSSIHDPTLLPVFPCPVSTDCSGQVLAHADVCPRPGRAEPHCLQAISVLGARQGSRRGGHPLRGHPARLDLCKGMLVQQMKRFFCKDTASFQKVANAFYKLFSYRFQTPKLHKSLEKMQVSQRGILEPLQTFCQ